jgi:hypothetical protein
MYDKDSVIASIYSLCPMPRISVNCDAWSRGRSSSTSHMLHMTHELVSRQSVSVQQSSDERVG